MAQGSCIIKSAIFADDMKVDGYPLLQGVKERGVQDLNNRKKLRPEQSKLRVVFSFNHVVSIPNHGCIRRGVPLLWLFMPKGVREALS
ncbi:hypothetical protein NPIL_262791 [Nephila pilipes]|uniref:Uncharacterized protein n=1 Tax=Nephila pilipes TaxID=299642 RepID=A0A8X6P5A1_NEPPI|nr:hypothetical protein NPIL_262791 [Nephila pilipes]